MSVINSMLRALDARGASAHPDAGAIHGAAAAPLTTTLPPLRKKGAAPTARLAVIALAGSAAIGVTAFADLGAMGSALGSATTGGARAPVPAAVSAAVPATMAGAEPAAPPALAQQDTAPGAQAAAAAVQPVAPGTPNAAPAAAPPRAAAVSPAPAVPGTAAGATHPSHPAAATAAPTQMPARMARLNDTALVPPTPGRVDKRVHGPTPEQRSALLYRQAVDAAQAGQRQAALTKSHELLAAEPRHALARQLAAALEQEAGAPERAIALLHEGLALDDRQAALALPLARLLATQGQADEALAVLERHAVRGPEADGLRAGVLARRGDFAAALPAYEAAARAQPMNAMWWLGLGVALESMGEPARARQAFAKAQAVGLPRHDLTAYVEQRLRALE